MDNREDEFAWKIHSVPLNSTANLGDITDSRGKVVGVVPIQECGVLAPIIAPIEVIPDGWDNEIYLNVTATKEDGTIFTLLDQVGFIELFEGLLLGVYKKPRRFHLFMMKLLLGWEWRGL